MVHSMEPKIGISTLDALSYLISNTWLICVVYEKIVSKSPLKLLFVQVFECGSL